MCAQMQGHEHAYYDTCSYHVKCNLIHTYPFTYECLTCVGCWLWTSQYIELLKMLKCVDNSGMTTMAHTTVTMHHIHSMQTMHWHVLISNPMLLSASFIDYIAGWRLIRCKWQRRRTTLRSSLCVCALRWRLLDLWHQFTLCQFCNLIHWVQVGGMVHTSESCCATEKPHKMGGLVIWNIFEYGLGHAHASGVKSPVK